jgi:selenocysteine lyase/cysteine desulfurase
MTWTASVEYLREKDIRSIQKYDDGLVDRVVGGVTSAGYRLVSPTVGPQRSTLVLFSHEDPTRNAAIHKRLQQEGVHIEERDQKLRISAHLYNTTDDIDRAIGLLAKFA